MTPETVHPANRRPAHVRLFGVLVALVLVAAACGKSSSSSSDSASSSGSSSTVLRLAFNADMQVPDPDIFYEVEGNVVVTSAYEGLVRYKPSSAEIEPALAESYDVSSDGLTYTFKLRSGIKFQDGTPLDAQTFIDSFKRRTDVNSAPAYMLADVESTTAPDPLTFVVKLKNPVSPFLDYLAAPYGPKAVSPKVLKDQAGSDFAQSYLKDHSAGTGPYYISKFEVGQTYELTRNDNYWDGKPYYSKINISIIPDMATQRLKLEGGELDMVLHGLPVADVDSFRKNDKFTVSEFPVLLKTVLASNPNKGPFKNQALREGLRTSLDKTDIVKTIYLGQATVSKQATPVNVLPDGLGADTNVYDLAKLKAAVDALPESDRSVDLGYSEDEGGTLPRLAEVIAAQLGTAGLKVTVRGIPIAEVFDLPNKPEKAPDLLLWTFNPDAAHPDTWDRIFYSTKGSLNYLQCSVPEADALMDQGLVETDKATMQQDYGKAGDAILASGCFVTIADNKDFIVARKGITDLVHQLPTPYTVEFKALKSSP